MRLVAHFLFQTALTAWVGGLWVIGYLVVPTLFYTLENRTLAGNVAGHIFEVSGWCGLALGSFLLFSLFSRQGLASLRTLAFWLIFVMLVLTAVSLFGIQPFMVRLKQEAFPQDIMESALRDRFSAWHGVSSILYLLQSLLALALLLRVNFRPTFLKRPKKRAAPPPKEP